MENTEQSDVEDAESDINMATVQKKPRKLPKLPKEEEQGGGPRGKGDAGRGNKQKDAPQQGRKRDLPPLKRTGKRDMDTKSMVEMGKRSPVDVEYRTSLTATTAAKSCYFYVDDDYLFSPVKMVIHPKKHRKMETVTRDLSVRMRRLPFGVRSIFTPRAKHRVHTLEDLTQDGHYVCSSNRKYARGLDVQRVNAKHVWHNVRPDSGKRVLNNLLKDYEAQSAKYRAGFRPGHDLSRVYTRQQPKKVTVMRNGEPDQRHMLLLNRRTAQTFEQVLKTLSELFQFAVRRLYTIEGAVVDGLNKIFNGPDYLVAAGLEPYVNMTMDGTSRARTRMSQHGGSQVNLRSRMQSRRDRLARTKGRWMVTLRTNALPSAGTQAQVTVTVYGNKGNSGPCTLGSGDGANFQPGQVDEFQISIGNVGEIYKIRLAHDNSGDFPGWLCDEVHMVDMDTKEELTFSCRRWLARDEDDQEITRELAVKRPGEPILPLVKYQVDVYTGDLWGGGTEANVYMTIYGDRGDTGVRQLYAETKGVYFRQGQMDSFEVEAVSLGHLKRIIVGHDGTGAGSGWFLDKIVIREPPFRQNQESTFYCGKWLDEGEDDCKIVRELRVQDEYMDDILEKRNWEFEKWKYVKDGQVMMYSVMTGKALRVGRDHKVDGVGEEKDKHSVFNVLPKKPMKVMLATSLNPNNCLAIDAGNITGAGKGGPYCEFRIRAQQDRTNLLESVKNPLQFITIGANGAPGDVRGILDKEPSRRFYVYAKGCFRHKGVIMLCTSQTQCINMVKDDDSLTGKGRRAGPLAQFKVHKVSPGGIRMFESVANPGNYIRLKDGKIDCKGKRDEDSHFLVLRHKDKGYITLQSSSQRGLFIGLTPEGKVHTTIDTGVRNIWLYPEVVEWGIPKTKSTEQVEVNALEQMRQESTPLSEAPPTPAPVRQYAVDPEEEEIVEEGDWSIHASTASELSNGDVAIVCYGDKGDTGPIILGAPPGKQIFQPGNDDEFRANLLKIGKMYKIRLELLPKISTKDPSWKVKDVRMQDLNSQETLTFNFDRWLSRVEDDHDIVREKPVVRPGENVLPVHKYVVSVYTGKEIGSETDAQPYINVFGERGDWGKRYLYSSNNNVKFRVGQVDVFHLEAVSLGNLQRCVIGHDNTGDDQGWFVEKVVIKETQDSTQDFVFPCNRWLDTGKDDRKIERTLMVKESKIKKEETEVEEEPEKDETQKPVADKKTYSLEVVTDPESSPPNQGRVHITLYGDRKKSEQIMLYAANPNDKTFEQGNIDNFMLETDDLGELYKVRIGRDDSDTWDRWRLGEVRLTDEATQEKIVFLCNRWLARDMEDGDLCRELPVVVDGKPRGVVQIYQVSIYTGDHWGANTDANVFITIHGTRGDSGKRLLHKCMNNRVKFKRGQMDTFELEAVNMEELTCVEISHDGHGHGAGLFVEKVVIKEKDTPKSHLQYVFPCGRWLDDHEGDCLTKRTLQMIDTIDTNQPPPAKESKKSNGSWTVTVRTSNSDKVATTAKVFLTVYGTNGHSDKLRLSLQNAPSFTPGSESQFQVDTGNIGKVTKIRLEHDNSGSAPDWKVDHVKLQDNDTNEELVFYVARWLAVDQDDGQICREIPVVRKGTPGLPVLRYIVAITTGAYKDAGTDNGTVSIKLIGADGDTGMRELAGPLSKNRMPWQSGQTDIYTLEAVSVGKVKKIEMNFNSAGQDRWYVETVRVSEGASALSQFVFYCHQWLLASAAQMTEFPMSEIQPSTTLLDELESIPRGFQKPVKTKGRWTVYVQTGTQNDSGTNEKVCMVLCGLKGESEPVRVKDGLNPGSFVKFEAKTGDIGLIFKIRVFFEEKHIGSSWFLAKMKLKDQETWEELHFEYNDWIESTNENPEGAIELPVIRPDLQPLKEQIYIVSVKTGNLPLSETSAGLHCNLIGQWGSTGKRSLAISSNSDMFRSDQTDSFTLTSIDLGEVEKVIIGHDLPGRGQGWFCDSVSVKVAEEAETVFPCNRWLDTGCNNRMLDAELRPIAKLQDSMYIPTKYKNTKDGKWNFHITYAGTDKLSMLKPGHKAGEISVVLYGYNSVKGPIELTGEDINSVVNLLSPGKREHFYDFEFDDLGEIEKIRVSSGYEGDTENVWTIQQVVLEDQTSQEMLTFDFRGWVGEVGGDIRKEMPLVLPGMEHRQVIQYYIEVHTSESEMNASTNASVFITLYGSNSDSGRRHLLRSLTTSKRFQAGQVDKFVLEAVDLGDLEKLVVAKGPGRPWLLEKIVVKKGEFDAVEHVFMYNDWIGDKNRQIQELEKTLLLTSTIPSQVAVPLQDVPNLILSDGSWSIEGTTGGRRGPEGPLDLVVVFCGQSAETKPLPLVSNRENPFQIGLTDVFKVKYGEKIGDLRKIRLGFIDQSVIKAWYVRKISFEDEDTHDTFSSELNEWVAIDNKLDGWKEFPVPWPAIQIPKVLKYVISLQIGAVNKDGCDSEIYLFMFGSQGNTGRRLLKHSLSNTEKIKQNQVDVFEIEAVDLGDLMKIMIGHKETEKGCGWFLDYIKVQESQDAIAVQFACNSWLDAGEGDGQIERTMYPSDETGKTPADMNQNNSNSNEDVIPVEVPLISRKPSSLDREPTREGEEHVSENREPTPEQEVPAEVEEKEKTPVPEPDVEEMGQIEYEPTPEPPQPEPQGTKWTVTTTTGGGAGEGTGSAIQMVVYGDKGQSQPQLIGENEEFRFSTGNADNFNLTIPEDLGEVYKVRVGFDGDDVYSEWNISPEQSASWFLEKLSLKNEETGKVYDFDSGIWIKMNEYQDFWRELPVNRGDNTLEVHQYQVTMYTGGESKAGTDANVFMQIFGEIGDTGYRKLMTSQTHSNKFEQGNRDLFEIGAVDLGKLTKIKVKHDGSGLGSGWLLDRVVIKETEETTIRYVFRCEKWLDDEAEGGLEHEFVLTEMLVSDEEEQQEDLPGDPWKIQTVTGDGAGEGTSCPIELVLYDDTGNHQSLVIGERQGFRFNPGATDEFNVRILEDLQLMYKVRIGFHGKQDESDWLFDLNQAPTWHLEQLSFVQESTGHTFEVAGPTWVKVDEHTDHWREQPVLQRDRPTPGVYQYHVEIITGDVSKGGTDANVFFNIHGDRGDTGMRRLMASKTHVNKFEGGNTDVFEINAVDLGDLTKVIVSHDGSGMGSGWFISHINIKQTTDSKTKYVFKCDKWLDGDGEGMVTHEFPLTEIVEEGEEKVELPKGNPWTVWTVTGSDMGEELDNPVDLVLYGSQGQSSPVVIGDGANFKFQPGQSDTFEIHVEEEIGDLYKVRVGFHGDQHATPWFKDYNLAPSWILESFKLKDETGGEDYEFEAGIPVEVEKHTDFWRELPVVNRGQPLNVYRYHVEVYTGDKFKAGTDAVVTLQMYGQQGDTGPRRLMTSKTNKDKFEAGQMDVFEIPAVDLGELTKVRLSHDASGAGSGWMLDKVVVKETGDASKLYVFNCGQWLDEGDGEKDVEMVLPLSEVVMATVEQEAEDMDPKFPDAKDGDWKVYVTTGSMADSGTDSNVTLTVYGDADNTGPIQLGNAATGFFYSGKTDEFDVFLDPENLGQLRKIRLEHDSSGKGWHVDKVVMVNKMTGSQIEFMIDKWLTLDERGFDIAVEVPVEGHDWPVREYVVRTETGDGFGSGTDAQVFINLIGTIGDSGKRWLIHNLEDSDDKFESGQTDTFVVQAVDLGRLMQVQVGHNGQGPGSGWYLKKVYVKEAMNAEETYVFNCEQWLHDEKEDGVTERLLTLDGVKKDPDLFPAPVARQRRSVEQGQLNEQQKHEEGDVNRDTNESEKEDEANVNELENERDASGNVSPQEQQGKPDPQEADEDTGDTDVKLQGEPSDLKNNESPVTNNDNNDDKDENVQDNEEDQRLDSPNKANTPDKRDTPDKIDSADRTDTADKTEGDSQVPQDEVDGHSASNDEGDTDAWQTQPKSREGSVTYRVDDKGQEQQ